MFDRPTHQASFGDRVMGNAQAVKPATTGDILSGAAVATTPATAGQVFSGTSTPTYQGGLGDFSAIPTYSGR
jgi:hypothetical protein